MERKIIIPKEQLEADLERMTLKAIAEKFRCSTFTVKRRMGKWGFKQSPDFKYTSPYVQGLLSQGVALTKEQEGILAGTLLGDGHLDRETRNAQLRFAQCIARREYVEWMRNKFVPFVSHPIYTSTARLEATGESYKGVSFRTVRHPEFTRFYHLFYPGGRKTVPEDIGDYLKKPIALAVWFMDDGYADKQYSVLHTQGFTGPECDLLLEALHGCFDLRGYRKLTGSPSRKRLILQFNGKSHYQLHEIIDPLMLGCFEHKKLEPGVVYIGVRRGEMHWNSKLRGLDVLRIRRLKEEGASAKEIASKFDIGLWHVYQVLSKKTWKHIK